MANRWMAEWMRGMGLSAVMVMALAYVWMPPLAVAQSPVGIAFSYAPEAGMGVCVGNSPSALDCARNQCAATQDWLRPQDCLRVAWCYPSGWSVGVAFMAEGMHWSEFSCGWSSREAAMAAGRVMCESRDKQAIEECLIGTLWDPQGKEIQLD